MTVWPRPRLARSNTAGAYAHEIARVSAVQRATFRGVPGVYAITFGHQIEEMLYGNAIPIKVGMSCDVESRMSAVDGSFVPSPLVVLRLYQPDALPAGREELLGALTLLEQHFHSALRRAGIGNPYRRSQRGVGTEWFFISNRAMANGLPGLDDVVPCSPVYRVEEELSAIYHNERRIARFNSLLGAKRRVGLESGADVRTSGGEVSG